MDGWHNFLNYRVLVENSNVVRIATPNGDEFVAMQEVPEGKRVVNGLTLKGLRSRWERGTITIERKWWRI